MKAKKLIPIISGIILITACTTILGDDDDDDDRFWKRQPGVAPVTSQVYKDECGSCHFAYQPGLLPARSWKKMMAGLADHFGDNAELDPETHKTLLNYLVSNSADKSTHRRSKKITRSIRVSDAPLRITDISYIKKEHDEIPDRLISGNEKVASLSNCNACHTTIETGSFSERKINIPGHGRWDD